MRYNARVSTLACIRKIHEIPRDFSKLDFIQCDNSLPLICLASVRYVRSLWLILNWGVKSVRIISQEQLKENDLLVILWWEEE